MLPELFKSFFSQIPFYQRYAMGPSFLVLWFFFSHVYCDMVLLFGKQSLHHVHAVEIEKNSRARDLENSIYKQVTSQIYLAEIILLMLATVVIYKKKKMLQDQQRSLPCLFFPRKPSSCQNTIVNS